MIINEILELKISELMLINAYYCYCVGQDATSG